MTSPSVASTAIKEKMEGNMLLIALQDQAMGMIGKYTQKMELVGANHYL